MPRVISLERKVPVIHVITPEALPTFKEASETMRALGKLGALHIRSRSATAKQIYDLAAQLAPLQDSTGCMLVINERVDVAMAVGAQGVQLPANSFEPEDVRQIAPRLLIGLSVHHAGQRSTPNWLLLGNIFPTQSHPGRLGIGLDPIRQLARSTKTPVIAIGGIKPEHLPELLGAGARGVAILSGVNLLTRYISEYERHANSGENEAKNRPDG